MSYATDIVIALLGPHADPGSGADWADLGPGGNDYSLEGGATWVNSTGYGSGTFNWGVRFTGTTDIVRALDPSSTAATIARPLTVFLRYYCEGGDGADQRNLVMTRDAGHTNNTGLLKGSNNKFSINDGAEYIEAPSAGPAQGNWVTLAFTSDTDGSKTCKLYVNGTLVKTTVNGDPGNGGTFFGSAYNFGQLGKDDLGIFTQHPHGVITDFCLWSRVLSGAEIAAIDPSSDPIYDDLLSPPQPVRTANMGLGDHYFASPYMLQGVGLGDHYLLSPAVVERMGLGELLRVLDPTGRVAEALGLGGRFYPWPLAKDLTETLGLGGRFNSVPGLLAALGLGDDFTPTQPRGDFTQGLRLGDRYDPVGPVIGSGRYRR